MSDWGWRRENRRRTESVFFGGRENREPSEIAAVAQRNVLSITLGRDQDCVFLSIFFKKYALKEYRDQREKQDKFPPSKKRGGKSLDVVVVEVALHPEWTVG